MLAVASSALALTYWDRSYIATTSVLNAVLCIGLAVTAARKPAVRDWNHRLWLAYLPLLIPFIISNGVLTGLDFWQFPLFNGTVDAVTEQIVWYNNDHNLSFRIFSMPIDDLFYGFLMIAMTVISYELIAKKMGLVTGSPPAERP
jgi:hypothetical protein